MFLGADLANQNRVVVFVDGFNLYHAIDELNWNPQTKQLTNTKHHLKWLDICSLSKALIHPTKDILVHAYYFSAYAGWISQDAQSRHRNYVAALRNTGITPIMGKFKMKPRKRPSCKHTWPGHEEKESDVNIALQLLQMAHENTFDKAIIFSADTDLAPAIRMVRNKYPLKEVYIAIPERRLKNATSLVNAGNGKLRVTESHIERNLFPEHIHCGDGKVINRPAKYTPPK